MRTRVRSWRGHPRPDSRIFLPSGGGDRIRTDSLRLAKPLRYQLRHTPVVESKGIEPLFSACHADVLPLNDDPKGLPNENSTTRSSCCPKLHS